MVTATRGTALEARYGHTPARRRRSLLIGVAIALVAAVIVAVWAVWTGIGGSIGSLQVSTLGFTQHGDTAVSVTWEVDGRASERLLCAIEAQASDGTIVGLKEVLLPVTGAATRSGTTTVRIVRFATTGLIASCRGA